MPADAWRRRCSMSIFPLDQTILTTVFLELGLCYNSSQSCRASWKSDTAQALDQHRLLAHFRLLHDSERVQNCICNQRPELVAGYDAYERATRQDIELVATDPFARYAHWTLANRDCSITNMIYHRIVRKSRISTVQQRAGHCQFLISLLPSNHPPAVRDTHSRCHILDPESMLFGATLRREAHCGRPFHCPR